AYTHQDIPFEKLVEIFQPERDLSRSPLFQVMFVLQHARHTTDTLPDLTVEEFAIKGTTTKFDLSFFILDSEQGLNCLIEYSTDLFEQATIRHLLGHWQTLLEGIVSSPTRHLADLPLLTLAEQQQLVEEWNDTARHSYEELCLHQFVEVQ